ncbi:MAG: hypothetical protein ACD_58C00287G0011 [uncultured bacterium]|nr:MAG: hypothetical protein ACD_58C00287G0011 [uncultured bacterium]
MKKTKKSEDEFELFDDCPICQTMKQGKNSMEDLKKSFRKAKRKGAVVGGSLFDKKKKNNLLS